MILSHVILAAGWVLFCTLHSILAAPWFKQIVKRRMGRQCRFYRLYYNIFAFLSFAAVVIYPVTLKSYALFKTNIATVIGGAIISLSGFTIMGICIVKYFMQLSGVSGLIENKTKNELMITGIHRFIRHPLYLGTFIFIWGLLVIFPYVSLLIVDMVVTIYTLIGLKLEEKKLIKEFGEKYVEYQREVPMIIPVLFEHNKN